jgi:hypothetical protein
VLQLGYLPELRPFKMLLKTFVMISWLPSAAEEKDVTKISEFSSLSENVLTSA